MRQVPNNRLTRYAIIGDGRVATHISFYLQKLNIPYSQWSRKNHVQNDLELTVSSASHVLLLINDSAIAPFIVEHEQLLEGKNLLHFSGALTLNNATSCHPLTTFGPKLYDLEFYQSIPFITDNKQGSDPILPGLKNTIHFLSPELKPLYHALCVVSGNFTSMLWAAVFDEFEKKLKLPKHILFPYMEKVFSNLMDDHRNCLTGPLVRGDAVTIEKNLQALKGSELQNLYESFIDFFNNSEIYKNEKHAKRLL